VRAGVAEDEVLGQLRDLVAAEGGELAAALVEEPAAELFGPLVAVSDRCSADPGEYALMIESILEGYLVHYATPRLLDPPDGDLRLLAGDYLYALGLSRLAALGDLEAVLQLADLISLCAQAHSGAESPSADRVEAIWALGAIAVAGGPWAEGESAKQGLRNLDPNGPAAALEAASERAAELGIGLEAQRALIAFSAHVSTDSPST
jgi:hypothetical protein